MAEIAFHFYDWVCFMTPHLTKGGVGKDKTSAKIFRVRNQCV